jgi:lantibiotic modifying enzyme
MIDNKGHNSDHICCGNAGRIDFFLNAESSLKDPFYRKEALLLASKMIARAKRQEGYSFGVKEKGLPNNGFFGGLAGVGYTFLRLAFPEKLPSILLFE